MLPGFIGPSFFPVLYLLFDPIHGATDASGTAVEDVGVDHGCLHILVAEQFLDCADVVTVLKQMCGKGVPKSMTGGPFGQPGVPDRLLDCPLNDRLIHVMAPLPAGLWIPPAPQLREYPLPAPL